MGCSSATHAWQQQQQQQQQQSRQQQGINQLRSGLVSHTCQSLALNVC
jgi:hypothetical protein